MVVTHWVWNNLHPLKDNQRTSTSKLLGRSSCPYTMGNFRRLSWWRDILCWRFSFVDDVLRLVSTLWWNRRRCCIYLTTKTDTTCRPPFWEVIAAANFSRWSSFRRPRVASSLAVEESNNGFGKPMGVRHVSREYEKGYKPLRGAEERMLFGCQLQERVGAAIRDFLERVWCFFERSWREVLDAGFERFFSGMVEERGF